MIPKIDKDPQRCCSYCPISLLNVDLKLFSKLLANRLSPLLQKIVNSDQAGFIPVCETRDNTMKAVNLIYGLRMSGVEGHLLSTDSEDAFSRVLWGYLWEVFEHEGLPSNTVTWIKSLYAHPTAQVKVNKTLARFIRTHE